MSNDLKRDDGKRLDKQNYETKAGYNKFDLLSLIQKCTRRSPHNEEDREVMMWAAWELCRSSYHSEYWARIDKIAIEDALLRIEESHLLLVLERLRELATEQFDPSEGFGLACAMRASSLLYEATASHELLTIKRVWSNAAEEGTDLEEIQEAFPVPPAHADFGKRAYPTLDMHTYKGKVNDRNFAHYLVSASRTEAMTPAEQEAREELMEQLSYEFTDDQIDVATTPISDQDDPWDDPSVSYPR